MRRGNTAFRVRPRLPRTGCAAVALMLLLAGCADVPGTGFGTLELSLAAAWSVPADRQREGGWIQLDNDFQIRVDAATATVAGVAVRAAADDPGAATSGAGDGGGFDPADPPPGYTLCHGGHCHADDGRLVSYEEIEAELAGGGAVAELATVAALPGRRFDLLAGGAPSPIVCSPACELPETELREVQVEVAALHLAGTVRDGSPLGRLAGERRWRFDLPAGSALHLRRDLAVAVGVDEPARVGLALELAFGPRLLDGLDWSGLAAANGATGTIDVDGGEDALASILAAAHAETLAVAVERDGHDR